MRTRVRIGPFCNIHKRLGSGWWIGGEGAEYFLGLAGGKADSDSDADKKNDQADESSEGIAEEFEEGRRQAQ